MAKIGILSIDINTPMFNYGAILHTWAFERFLEANGFDNIELIDYSPEVVEKQNRLFPFLDLITNCHKKLSFNYSIHYFTYLRKLSKINHFKKQLRLSKNRYFYSKLDKNYKFDYDLVIAEDDVLWSKHFLCKSKLVDPFFFLFHPAFSNIKKMSYSVSLAECDYSNEEMKRICLYLKDFFAISVRENYAKEFLKKYEIESEAVIDAVFLLSKNDYLQIVSNRFKGKKYVLLYLPAQDNTKLREEAKMYASEKGLNIVEINNKAISKKGSVGDAGVEDFLSAIYYSETVFTNSFHALCFSLIFERNFFIYSRLASGKLTDFCKILGLDNRFIEAGESYKNAQPLNFETIRPLINKYSLFSKKRLLGNLKLALGDYKND